MQDITDITIIGAGVVGEILTIDVRAVVMI